MISKRIEYLLWVLATDNTQLAAYAGCSESNFSRLKSGSREPDRDSVTIRKFANAVCKAARDRKMTETLRSLTKAAEADDETLSRAVIDWIFDTRDSTLPCTPWGINARQFGEKLAGSMEIAGLSSSKLSRLANIDPSYISRMKSGSRMPKNNPSLIYRICGIISGKAFEKGKEKELFELTGQAEGDVTALTAALFGWLYDKRSTEGSLAVGRLINTIAAMPDTNETVTKLAEIPVYADNSDIYTGISGLQSAVLRFLGTAAKRGRGHLMLYSDQSQEWLGGLFKPQWDALLRACLNKGIRMTIVHNLDMKPAEMFDSINNWLPLYTTGLIKPYYCTLSRGERQSTTIFLDEGRACIHGVFVCGLEKDARYRFTTDTDELDYVKKNFEMILNDCKPLIRMIEFDDLAVAGARRIYSSGGIEMYLKQDEVIVQKVTAPKLSFCFENPTMVNTFRRFVEERMRFLY